DFGTDRTGPAPTGIDDHMCRFPVQGLANLDQLLDSGQRIFRLQQWPGLVLAGALELLCNRGAQIDNDPPLMQITTTLRRQDCASASRQNNARALGEGIDHAGLTGPEALLSLHVEYPGDVGTGDKLDFPVGIEKRHVELTGEHPANGTLAHSHGADEKYAA